MPPPADMPPANRPPTDHAPAIRPRPQARLPLPTGHAPAPRPRTCERSEAEAGVLPAGAHGRHLQLVATSWQQVPELEAGRVGVSLEQLPFRGATGAQPAEAEGAAEPTWPWGVPVQREAGRPALAADRHPQRRSWGTGVVRAPSALYPKGGRVRKGQSRDGPRGETALFARPPPPTSTRPAGTLFWGLALAFLRKGYEGGGEGQRKGCPLVRPPPQAWPKGSRQDTKVRRPPAWAAALCPVGLGRSCLCPTSCRSAGALGAAGGLNTTESSPNPATAPAPISPWPRSLGARGSPQTGLGVSFQGVCRESWEVAGGAVLPPLLSSWLPGELGCLSNPEPVLSRAPGGGRGERPLAADTPASRSGPTSALFSSWLSRQEETQAWRSNALGWADG